MCSEKTTNATGINANATSATPIGVIKVGVIPLFDKAATISPETAPLANSLIASTKAILG